MKFLLFFSLYIFFIKCLHPNHSLKKVNTINLPVKALTKQNNVVIQKSKFIEKMTKNIKKKRNEKNEDDDTQEGIVILKTVFPYNRKEKNISPLKKKLSKEKEL